MISESGYTIVGTWTDSFDRAKAKANIEDVMTKHPKLALVTGLFEYNSTLAVEVFKQSGKAGKILIAGFDEGADVIAGIRDGIVLGTFATDVCDIVRMPILSTSLETYFVDCGITTNRTGGFSAPVDGVYFSYSHGLNSGKWLCCCMNNSTLTSADSGITVAANTWYRLDIKIGTTTALFYIDKVLVATVAGIPIGTSRTTGKSALIRKSVGTASMSVIVDYMHIIQGTNR